MLFRRILRQPLVRERQQDKHGTVLLRDRQQILDLFFFQRNGIDERTTRIDAQRRLDDIHMAGIDAERQIYRGSHLIDGV